MGIREVGPEFLRSSEVLPNPAGGFVLGSCANAVADAMLNVSKRDFIGLFLGFDELVAILRLLSVGYFPEPDTFQVRGPVISRLWRYFEIARNLIRRQIGILDQIPQQA